MVESLLSILEALGWIPSTVNTLKNKRVNENGNGREVA